MNIFRVIIFFALTIFLLGACRSTKKITTAISKKDTVIAPVPSVEPIEDSQAIIKSYFSKVQDNRIDFTTFSAKMDVDYKGADGKKYDVNAHLRMYKDSVIWISVTAILGIEGLRTLITRDSVKILDKQNKVFTAKNISYLQEITSLPLTLASLQDLLIGNPVFFDNNIHSYTRSSESVSLLCVSPFIKNLSTFSEKGVIMQCKIDDANGSKNRTCFMVYDDYEDKKEPVFSEKREIQISEKERLEIKLNFKQYAFNETLSFPFNIPKNYIKQ